MSEAALRTVFAELGFNVDLSALEAANKAVDAAVKKARALVGANAEVDRAEEQLARDRKRRTQEQKAAPAAVMGQTPARASGRLVLGGGGVDPGEWKAHIDRLKRLQELQANASQTYNPFGPKKDAERGQGATSFGGKAEAWSKPVKGLVEAVERFEGRAQSAFGQKLPAAVQTFMGKLGIARTDFATMARVAGAAMVGVIGVLHRATTAAFDFAAAFTADSEALRETAREARVTSSELQAMQHAGAASGVGTERVTRSITAFGNKLRDANNRMAGGSGVSHTLRRLGISMRDASGQVRPTVDLLDEVAVAMEHISSPRRRIRVAESLGLDRRMLDILHTGAGGIRALREEMAELGGGVSPEATEAARKYAQAQERLRVATTSVRSVLFVALAPALQWVIDKTSKLFGWFARMSRGTRVFQIALGVLAAVALAAAGSVVVGWLAAAAPFILAAAAVGLLVLVFDDLSAAMRGGNSLVGEFIDGMFGVGTTQGIVAGITEEWEELKEDLRDVQQILEFIEDLHRRVVGGVVRHVSGTLRTGINAVRHFLPASTAAPPAMPPEAAVGGDVDGAGMEAPDWMRGRRGRAVLARFNVPATRTVSAGGAARGNVVTQTQTLQLAPGAIQVTGVGDPRRAAEMVIEEINRRSRAARDQQAPGARDS